MPAEEFGLSDIDAITGATISSGAAASAINAAIAAYNQEAGVAGEDLSLIHICSPTATGTCPCVWVSWALCTGTSCPVRCMA